MTHIVGIDIAKDTFDVCLVSGANQPEVASFANGKTGMKQLQQWLKKRAVKTAHVCLEATGVYGDLLAETLYERGFTVSVVNPARINAYAASRMQRNKTDALDAALIADYCRTQQPPAWTPPASELKELRALVRHLDDLKDERQRARNRLEAQTVSQAVARQLKQQVTFLEQQIAETEALIRNHVNQHPDLKRQRDLLKSIPGIGHLTACQLLAEVGDMQRFDHVGEVVAFIGLNPRQHQSGKKQTTHGISRMGRASLRAALYLPAVVAKQHNPRLKDWAQQLSARGLTGKQVIVAVMRKLVHLAYGVLKHQQPFDPHYLDKRLLIA
ncbi:MAG: IS110 family transposase [Chloroflexota bacterium]|nr:IS110 family transposase [Chloroflexota bacterium]